MRAATLCLVGAALSACAFPAYDPEPTSAVQWQRRQDEIERREAERVRLCAIMNKDTDRYRRDCARPGDPS